MRDYAGEIGKEFSGGGFFYNIRKMTFVKIDAVRAIETIRHLDPNSYNEREKRDLALLIWNLPAMALWWRDRCVEMGADKVEFEAHVRELGRVVEEKMKVLLGQ
ncbi:hypothetical protein A6U98_11615 [Rhizobium sp. WYCCWR10014]|uniref:hypothetical protein n=1 Tax=Rhizobium sp. WYCCWR10014 TaxID=1825933 RepID=UPI0007E3B0DB|nr:hypothetical protein [Rhizobium sp. WYCCWR10014]OAV48903.1 hypothetical protein A6U98_11615 [Rhizobium sp. WYCCWR10014]